MQKAHIAVGGAQSVLEKSAGGHSQEHAPLCARRAANRWVEPGCKAPFVVAIESAASNRHIRERSTSRAFEGDMAALLLRKVVATLWR